MLTVFITIGIFALIMAMMAVGVVFSGKCLRGSCGGSEDVIGPDGEPIRCATCPKRFEENHVCDGHGHDDEFYDEDEETTVEPAASPGRGGR